MRIRKLPYFMDMKPNNMYSVPCRGSPDQYCGEWADKADGRETRRRLKNAGRA